MPSLPRVGLKSVLPEGFELLEWFGCGPHENYIDRDAGALVGCYESTVTDQYVPYVLPHEHGNYTDMRWVRLSEKTTEGDRFEFSASHFTACDLFSVIHTDPLSPRAEIFLTLDLRQRGVGSGSYVPPTCPEYDVDPGIYCFEFRLGVMKSEEITGERDAEV